MVKVVLQRKKSMVLWSTVYIVSIDGRETTFIGNGESKEIEIPEGTHKIKLEGKAFIGGRRSRTLISMQNSEATMDFNAKKTYVNLIPKIGWTNKMEISKAGEEDSASNNIEQGINKVTIVAQIKDSEYMQKRMEKIKEPTFVAINIDGMDMAVVKDLEKKEIELTEGEHKISVIYPFNNTVCDTKTINVSNNTKIYLELIDKKLIQNKYPYDCKMSIEE